jgi:hypothetical protein
MEWDCKKVILQVEEDAFRRDQAIFKNKRESVQEATLYVEQKTRDM